MFGIFISEQSKARHDAKNWLHLANKVIHYRRDQVSAQELHAILQAENDLKNHLVGRADVAKLRAAIERLEGCLRRSGGSHYPKSGMADNVEFALVALILFLGIRAFLVQPFKIPTNSMWPTYYGMTAESFATVEEEPGRVAETLRLAAFGAKTYRVDAPADGELFVALPLDKGIPQAVRVVAGRRWGVLPARLAEYVFVVGGQAASVAVPEEFEFGRVYQLALQRPMGGLDAAYSLVRAASRGVNSFVTTKYRAETMRLVPTGRQVKKGERIVSFDILTGDQLFVDRVSYHFVPPRVGDAFVFRTDNIPEITGANANSYYIKRLVGAPGDELEVRAPELWRNGAPITGSIAFEKNARQVDRYPGYTFGETRLAPGTTLTVPADSFFAMGDNSPNSADSRRWGFVPADDVVGRPLFIYYPFTRRWGPAR
ncbi:MAG: signal peptidase I [Opitutaceae bacterium]|nr:signal peptidase I [Opitutaceae bacterium]